MLIALAGETTGLPAPGPLYGVTSERDSLPGETHDPCLVMLSDPVPGENPTNFSSRVFANNAESRSALCSRS